MDFEHPCQFYSFPRRSQSLCNDRCQNILYKSVFEHFIDIKDIAALLLTSKSFQNSSFGANFIVNFIVDANTIELFHSVLSPSSCFSLQFVPSLSIKQPWGDAGKVDHRISNFVSELVRTKYFHLSLRSLSMEFVSDELLPLFFGSSTSKEWPRLQELSLENSGLNDSTLELICKKAVALQTVNFSKNAPITNAGLAHISNFSSITSLNLTWCNLITDDGLESISKIPSITFLSLSFCDMISDVGLDHIAQQLSSITSLDLSWCNLITDVGLEHLSKLSNVTLLDLYGCDNVTDVGLEHISTLSRITDLDLSCCYMIGDPGLEHLSRLSGLTFLSVYNCNMITDIGLEHLSKLSNIIALNFNYCNKITAVAKKTFCDAFPNCKI